MHRNFVRTLLLILIGELIFLLFITACAHSDSVLQEIQPGIEAPKMPEKPVEVMPVTGGWQQISLEDKQVQEVWLETKSQLISEGHFTNDDLKDPIKTELQVVAGRKYRFTCPPHTDVPDASEIVIIVWIKPDGSRHLLQP